MREIVFAGSGGQGVLTVGLIISDIAATEGLNVTWVPSYGPEMRGGTANCTVILTDERIGAPLVDHPTEIVVMNRPSLAKFEPVLRPGGTAFVNSSMIPERVGRTDVTAVYVPCDEIAEKLGSPKVGNMVMLGAYVAATQVLKVETIEAMIHAMFTGRKADLVPMNLAAFHQGIACVTF